MVTVRLTGCCSPRTVLLVVTVWLTGCCSPRTDCPVGGDCAVDKTYSARTGCPVGGDCAVDMTYSARTDCADDCDWLTQCCNPRTNCSVATFITTLYSLCTLLLIFICCFMQVSYSSTRACCPDQSSCVMFRVFTVL